LPEAPIQKHLYWVTASGDPVPVRVTISDATTPTITDTNPTTEPSSTGVATASTGDRVVVIGEDMPGRVKPLASQYGYETMRDLPSNIPETEKLSLNREWINSRMDEGYTIVDLGPARGYPFYPYISSPYYAMEQVEIAARNYARWLPVWGVFD
jgi:hypothetical protein